MNSPSTTKTNLESMPLIFTSIFSGFALLMYPGVFIAGVMSYANPSKEPLRLLIHQLFVSASLLYPIPILASSLLAWTLYRRGNAWWKLWTTIPWLTLLLFGLLLALHFGG